MSPPIDINFQTIRTHHGTQTKGFEELVSQNFRIDTATAGRYYRVEGAGGDGGVEAYCVRPDGSKIGLQSKFFSKLQDAQWKQLGKSVTSAISNHPELVEYRMAVPLDRNPAQLKKWESKIVAWNQFAASKGFKHEIAFVWQGQSELIAELIKAPKAQLLTYWFGAQAFTDAWMDRILKLAVQNLDKRYSPDEHVKTQAGLELGAFAHLPEAVEKVKSGYLKVIKAWDELHRTVQHCSAGACGISNLVKVAEAVSAFRSIVWPAEGIPNLEKSANMAQAIRENWLPIHEKVEEENEAQKKEQKKDHPEYEAGPYDGLLRESSALLNQLEKWYELTQEYRCSDFNTVLVDGEAGIGKSHLLAAITAAARARGQPALLLLGEYFTEQSALWPQLVKVTDWKGEADALLSSLNQAALIRGCPALIALDAINESPHRNLWLAHLNAFVEKLSDYPNVRLIVSCRSDFLGITVPENILRGRDNRWARITHEGLGESVFEAVGKYFGHYKVKASHFPPLLPEFANPLFLRLFCETFEDSTVPDGPLSLTAVMDTRIDRLAAKLLRDIDCPVEDTRGAIYDLAKAIRENGARPIEKEAARKLIEARSPSRESSRSLYHHLKSNSILVETRPGLSLGRDRSAIVVRFAFERFGDFFVAKELLDQIKDEHDLLAEITGSGKLAWLQGMQTYWRDRGVANALAIAIPERFHRELAELVPVPENRAFILEDFLKSVVWRSANSFSEVSFKIFRESAEKLNKLYLETLLTVACVPGHPFNAQLLHKRLAALTLPERESVWTIPLSEAAQPYHSKPAELIRWVMTVPLELISEEQAKLLGYLLFWCLSSNFRGFRFQASLGAIRILQGRVSIVCELLRAFESVDDPYIRERAYAVACGVAMRERNKRSLEALAEVVYQQVFAKEEVNPHILLREYARCILEAANHLGSLPATVGLNNITPPLRSRWPKIISEQEFKELGEQEGWRKIVRSTEPNSRTGFLYGDFGRYTMQAEVQHFSDIPLERSKADADDDSIFDATIAQRWILQRIRDLGYTAERFREYDRNHTGGRERADVERFKVERISKKYQWIALHELLGFLSDHFHMAKRWKSHEPGEFLGAWQLYTRDFDPSQPLVSLEEEENESNGITKQGVTHIGSYKDPFGDAVLCADREKWVVSCPDDFGTIIQGSQKASRPDEDWFVLSGMYEWKEPEFKAFQLSVQGQLKLFLHIRSWLVKTENLSAFLEETKDLHFWGDGCDLVTGEGWIGEYPWGAPFADFEQQCASDLPWLEAVNTEYAQTTCRADTGERMVVPSPQLCRSLKIQWGGEGSDFVESGGELVVTQMDVPTAFDQRPCLVRRSYLSNALSKSGLSLVWGVVGEKTCYSNELEEYVVPKQTEFSGIYYMQNSRLLGGITKHVIQTFPIKA